MDLSFFAYAPWDHLRQAASSRTFSLGDLGLFLGLALLTGVLLMILGRLLRALFRRGPSAKEREELEALRAYKAAEGERARPKG